MAPPAMGLKARGEQQLQQLIATVAPRQNADDDEALIISHVFLGSVVK